MREVAAVPDVDGPSLAHADHDYGGSVEERHRQDQDRHEHGEIGAGRVGDVALEQRERGQNGADEQAAAVSQEHGGGVEVEEQKAEETPHERHQDQADEKLAQQPGIDEEHARGHEGDTGGEAVHVVEEVECVRDPHHPEERDRGVQPVGGHERRADVGRNDHHGSDDLAQNLPAHLEPGPQDVVREADAKGQGRAHEQGEELLLHSVGFLKEGEGCTEVGLHERERVQKRDEGVAGQDDTRERKEDGQSTQTGHGHGVDLAGPRLIHDPQLPGHGPAEGNQSRAQGQGGNHDQDSGKGGAHDGQAATRLAASNSR